MASLFQELPYALGLASSRSDESGYHGCVCEIIWIWNLFSWFTFASSSSGFGIFQSWKSETNSRTGEHEATGELVRRRVHVKCDDGWFKGLVKEFFVVLGVVRIVFEYGIVEILLEWWVVKILLVWEVGGGWNSSWMGGCWDSSCWACWGWSGSGSVFCYGVADFVWHWLLHSPFLSLNFELHP